MRDIGQTQCLKANDPPVTGDRVAKEAQHRYLDVSLPYRSLMVSVTPRHLLILAGNSVFIFIQQQQRRNGPYAIVTSLSFKF